MLTHLCIRNYVLIKELDIDWHNGFSVITGETGAGKSILLGAIGLLMGLRADTKSILPGASKCTIEGTFKQKSPELQAFFSQNDLDFEDGECIIRRELTTSGKSRSFINDTPVTLVALRSLANLLIDIHSQHQNLLLGEEDFQLKVLDTVAQNAETRSQYQARYQSYKDTQHKLAEEKARIAAAKAEEDYLSFQLGQITELNLKEKEDETLRNEQQTLTHAEEIQSSLYQVTQALNGDQNETSVLDGLKSVEQNLLSVTRIFAEASPYAERVESAIIELRDIEADLCNMADRIESNPERLEEVSKRLDSIYTLEQKHGAKSSDELLDISADLQKKLDEISHGEESVAKLEQQLQKEQAEARRLATLLHGQRVKAARQVESHITKSLSMMEIPDNQFNVQITSVDTLTEKGADKVVFLFSANKNMPQRPIAEAASGGETARVMLALKALMSVRSAQPTIIFDEIDTGVSGRVADAMARLMQQMSTAEDHQVIAITHLPQIAAQGDTHYFVYKENAQGNTVSHIRQLTDEERVTELAHMLSGTNLSQAAIDNAIQLLKK